MNITTIATFDEVEVELQTLKLPFVINVIISDELKEILTFYFHFVIHTIIQIFGMLANLVNIVTFLKVGLAESVTISFFALAISDFFYLFFFLAARVPKWMDLKYPFTKLPHIFIFYNPLFLDISMLLTIFIAVQKSCCVAIPLLFKNVFNRRVSQIVIILIYVLMIGTYIPFLASHGFESIFSSKENTTVLKYVRFKHRGQVFFYWRLLNKTVLPTVAQFVVLVCTIILTFKLKTSARFRHSATTSANSAKSEDAKLGLKEKRAIQAVNMVTIIFFICNLPECVMHLVVLVNPEYRRGEKYINLYQLLSNVQNTLIMLNASVNIFIYLKYNSKYYESFMKMMTCPICLPSKKSSNN